jgi:hypothetical protein
MININSVIEYFQEDGFSNVKYEGTQEGKIYFTK